METYKRETIKQVLIRRDKLTPEEAQDRIDEAQEQLDAYLDAGNMTDAYNICADFFGLEPDYLDDLTF